MSQPSTRPTARRALAALGAGVLALTLTPTAVTATNDTDPIPPDTSQGYAGHCLDNLGVTMVIDFQDLGEWGDHDGEPLVRCATSGTPGVPFSGTGLDALQQAGIGLERTSRWGLGFICRIEGRPAADEPLPINGNPGYLEPCIDTPPAAAHWSYWHSGDTPDEWVYSQMGVTGRSPEPGSYDGWSFALNASETTNPPPTVDPTPPTTQRIAGGERYSTAEEIAARYPSGADTVYVATGLDYPDALAGAARAGSQEAPVLLTQQGRLPGATVRALEHLEATDIVVLGGTESISNDVVTDLGVYASGSVTRTEGANRYETAAAIAETYDAGLDTVYVATGQDYPDALSVTALAAVQEAPILLTTPGNLPGATRSALERLEPEQIVVVGGTTAVSGAVFDQLKDYAPTPGAVSRLAGDNRYETSRAVAEEFPSGADVGFVATGIDFPDALSGAALAGRFSGPVVLTNTTSLPSAARGALTHVAPERIVVLGGDSAVDDTVVDLLEEFVVRP